MYPLKIHQEYYWIIADAGKPCSVSVDVFEIAEGVGRSTFLALPPARDGPIKPFLKRKFAYAAIDPQGNLYVMLLGPLNKNGMLNPWHEIRLEAFVLSAQTGKAVMTFAPVGGNGYINYLSTADTARPALPPGLDTFEAIILRAFKNTIVDDPDTRPSSENSVKLYE